MQPQKLTREAGAVPCLMLSQNKVSPITLIDNYADESVLDMLTYKKTGVAVTITNSIKCGSGYVLQKYE